ncbi:hypothetical protein DF051_39000 [Burkholderia contaminans]|uniref:Uncharacterized protein n=1 Tax=Burkholderia contaminans TaxID=488447 RepID=A0A3N8NTL1_9BURK|nr:hypothetical protein DF051_39000 [Burkholderia contaminans]
MIQSLLKMRNGERRLRMRLLLRLVGMGIGIIMFPIRMLEWEGYFWKGRWASNIGWREDDCLAGR